MWSIQVTQMYFGKCRLCIHSREISKIVQFGGDLLHWLQKLVLIWTSDSQGINNYIPQSFSRHEHDHIIYLSFMETTPLDLKRGSGIWFPESVFRISNSLRTLKRWSPWHKLQIKFRFIGFQVSTDPFKTRIEYSNLF